MTVAFSGASDEHSRIIYNNYVNHIVVTTIGYTHWYIKHQIDFIIYLQQNNKCSIFFDRAKIT